MLEKFTRIENELCSRGKFRFFSEKSCKYWYYLYHKDSDTYKHTNNKKYRIGHCSFDFACYRVDFFCLFCYLYKCLIELTGTLTCFDNRYFSISETSIVISESFMHSTTSLYTIDHKCIKFLHSWIFFLFFECIETFEYCQAGIYHSRHDSKKYYLLAKVYGSSLKEKVFDIRKIGFLFLYFLTFLYVEDDDIGCCSHSMDD